MPTINAGSVATVYCPLAGSITITPGSTGRVSFQARGFDGGQSSAPRVIYAAETVSVAAGDTVSLQAIGSSATYTTPAGGDTALSSLVSGAGNTYNRWCIPGKDSTGTLFKDASGAGNDGTIDASNSGPFAVDNRISTIVHASAGGVTLPLAAGDMDFTTDSAILAFMMTNEDPAGSEVVASWGPGTGNFPGFYFSHRVSAAGVGRVICNRGNGSVVSGSDSTVKFSNAGGTRETHVLIGFDGPTGSVYLYRDGVLAASNAGLMTGANVFTIARPLFAPRLGGNGGTSSTVAGVFRGWQGYVFAGKGLPLNIGRIAAMLAESPSVPLRDIEFQFAA
jgi:hypothetical protein